MMVQEQNPIFINHKYEFPLLTGKQKIIEKINSNIAGDFLEIEIYNARESIFENVWATRENSIARLSDLTYQINLLSNRIYSVTLSAVACGAYCEYFSHSYNYDLSDGNIIVLDSLFGFEEKAIILRDLSNKKRVIIENHIMELKESDDSKDNEEYSAIIELYENCLESLPFDSLEYFDFKIKDSEIILISDRCSAHVNRAIDDLGEYKFVYSKKKIDSLLNDYGKTILKPNAYKENN